MIWMMTAALAGTELPECAGAPDAEASASIAEMYESGKSDTAASSVKSQTKAVLKLHKKGLICTAADHYKAGAILMRSRDSDALQLSHELAKVAAHNQVDRAKWLSNNSFDRWQISLGHEQRFGTQTGDGGQCLYPIDEAFPDENRVAWGAKPLDQIYAAFLELREVKGKPATSTTLHSLGLFCRQEPW